MASLDILHPLAGDQIDAGTVNVLVAYDFQSHARRTLTLRCWLSGTASHGPLNEDVDSSTPGTAEFSFGPVAAGTYRVDVEAVGTALSDFEDAIQVGFQAQEGRITTDAPPPPLVGDQKQGERPGLVLRISGTHQFLQGGDVIHVRVYSLVPGHALFGRFRAWLARTFGGANKSKRPFDQKFTPRSARVQVTHVLGDGTWWEDVNTSPHTTHRLVRATLTTTGGRTQQHSRARRT